MSDLKHRIDAPEKSLLFFRHSETIKNIRSAFSGSQADDVLTDAGQATTQVAISTVQRWVNEQSFCSVEVLSSDSARTTFASHEIAKRLGVALRVDSRLKSIDGGPIGGLDESTVADKFPEYFRKLSLYRLGVYNSYDIPKVGEDLHSFEGRVDAALVELEQSRSAFFIICAHKSTITAALLRYARLFHGYPTTFYGFCDIPLASLSLVEYSRRGEVAIAGAKASDFPDCYRAWRRGRTERHLDV